jgi:hypothetical protein
VIIVEDRGLTKIIPYCFLLDDETLTPPFPGLLRYLAWTAMAQFLRPAVNAFDAWRDEERWLRRYCPT